MGFFNFLGGVERQINPFDNNATYKNPSGNGQRQSVATQAKNTAVGLAKGFVSPFSFFAKTDIINPAKEVAAEVTGNKQADLNATRSQFGGTNSPTAALRQIGGNAAQVGLTFLAPGASKAIEGGATSLLGESALAKVTGATVAGAAVGAPFNVANTISSSEPLTAHNLEKSAAVGAGSGALLSGGLSAGGQAISKGIGDFHAQAEAAATKTSGLKPEQIVNENEAGTLRDWASYKMGDYNPKPSVASELDRQARNAADTAGIDITSGSSRDIATRIENYISQRSQHIDARNSVLQGGYISLGGGDAEKLAGQDNVSDIKKTLEDKVPAQEVDKIAPAIAQTNDPNIVKNIVDNAVKPVDTAKPPSIIPEQPTAPTGESVLGSIAVGDKPRGFIDTLKNSDNSSQPLKDAASGISPQTYTQKPNQKLVDTARIQIDENKPAVMADLLSKDHFTDQDVASAQELVRRAQTQPGGIDDATVALVDQLDTKLRESGRAVQAASLWNRLSPEGILKLAARKVRQARELKGNAEFEPQTAQDIKQTVEGFSSADQPKIQEAIQKTVKQIANEQQSLPLEGIDRRSGAVDNTGTKLAKNVERAASPEIKQKADTLVAELTKKVKQEYLDPKVTVKRSPTKILQEVFSREGEAKDAYALAQDILKKKYENVPTMQKALDKFFGSKLERPAAESTISNAIKEQLRNNNVRISKAIFESWANQGQSVEAVAKSLTKEGFDARSASSLATEVTNRLNKQFADAKITTLERLAADAPAKTQTTYIEKINKLSNLGALDNQDYLQLARAKLKLPDLSTETAQNISALAQKLQGMPDGYEKFQILKQIQDEIGKATPTSLKDKIAQVVGAPKSIMASYDLSAPLRQGAVLGSRFPKEFVKASTEAAKYFSSTEAYDRGMAEIATRPNAPLYDRMGLALALPGGIHEEAFASTIAEKIPLGGRGIAASDRGYTGFLTKLRADSAEHIINDLKETGIDPTAMSDKQLKSIGRFINTASGRGDLGILEKHAQSLGEALFSPRLWKSRLDMLNPKYYYDLKGPARTYALQSAASFASIAGTVLGLASLAGAKVETDPRSSDFLKIKMGDTRYDILGGFQQNIVFAWRQISGEKKSSTTGAITKLGDKFGAADRFSILSDFVQNKENPVISAGSRILKGKDAGGNKVNPATEIGKLFIPLGAQDTYSAITNTGNVAEGIAKAAPGFAGVGVSTYGTKDLPLSDKQKATIQLLQQKGASQENQDAYKAFYQTVKDASGTRTNVNDKITEALTAGDTAKAQKLASDYNKKYATSFKVWLQKYGQYEDKTLAKEYNANKIKLTPTTIKTRTKSIKANPLYQVTLGGK